MTPRKAARAAAALALLALAGCNFWYNTVPSPDDLVKMVPWFDHMVKGPQVKPYARGDIPRTTVPGTVPITGSEPMFPADWMTNTAGVDKLVNPLPADAAVLAKGDTTYHTFCAVCHGVVGAADGPVSAKIGARSLITPIAMALSDGYLYTIIRQGRGVMPPYGDKIWDRERRWAVVHYVRTLQQAAVAAMQPAPAAPGGTPK